jgi:hypothetical protein
MEIMAKEVEEIILMTISMEIIKITITATVITQVVNILKDKA